MAWFTGGPLTNPADGVVLADTGAIPGGGTLGHYLVITATVQETVLVQRRNAANNATVSEFTIRIPPNSTQNIYVGRLTFAGNERLRLVQQGALVGTVHAVITQEE